MTVRQQAYNEVYEWLQNDKKGPPPAVPGDLHPIAADEWKAGADEAHENFQKEDEEMLDYMEDLVVFAVKATILLIIFGVVYWVHNPYGMVFGGLAELWLLWKWL